VVAVESAVLRLERKCAVTAAPAVLRVGAGVRHMQIRDVMNHNVTCVHLGSTMREAAEILSHSWASDLMVVDAEECFVGVLSEGDLIRAVLPRFEELMLSSGLLTEGFQVFIEQGRESADKTIDALVIRNPITLGPDDEALKAASKMVTENIRRLPVVEDGRLVGTIARADICHAVLR
jgi:CBS domain-containing protein